MTPRDPTRWSAIDSEAEAGLRDTLQSLRASGPDPSEVEAMVRRVEQAAGASALSHRGAERPLRGLRLTAAKCVGVAALLGGLAWPLLRPAPPSAAFTASAAASSSATPTAPRDAVPTTPRGVLPSAPRAVLSNAGGPHSAAPAPPQAPVSLSDRANEPRATTRDQPLRTTRPSATARAPITRLAVERRAVGAREQLTRRATPQQLDIDGAGAGLTTSVGQPRLPTELELLTEAQRVLASAPARALLLVERHAHSFPHGTLAQERDELRIEALSRLQRTDQAKQRAREFERLYPGSAHLARIRAAVD